MLKITFRGESDLFDYSKSVEEYRDIWEEYGTRIVSSLVKHTGQTFKESEINANISKHISRSHPLNLKHTLSFDDKKYVIVHELGHRIFFGCMGRRFNDGLESHKILYLVLADVVGEVYGEKSLSGLEKHETRIEKRDFYQNAWKWASQFDTYEKRQNKLKEILKSKPQNID